ncbi:MAG: RsbRD N-terminal domain-containing protein [SAR324 cluster bacterium]|nr:RsbRD N-terminal domain-containing protein [SAR324 cluster bacterium]
MLLFLMNPQTHLESKKSEIVLQWRSQVFSLYGEESKKILKRNKAEYLNPMGARFSTSFEELFECVLTRAGKDQLDPILEQVIRFTAVQEGTPSSSLNFLFVLKKIVNKELESAGITEIDSSLNTYFDRLIKFGIDHLVASREFIAKLKVEEMERKTYSLIKLLNSQKPPILEGEA